MSGVPRGRPRRSTSTRVSSHEDWSMSTTPCLRPNGFAMTKGGDVLGVDSQRARGKAHHAALRALGDRWLEILWHCLHRGVLYDEAVHVATGIARSEGRPRQLDAMVVDKGCLTATSSFPVLGAPVLVPLPVRRRSARKRDQQPRIPPSPPNVPAPPTSWRGCGEPPSRGRRSTGSHAARVARVSRCRTGRTHRRCGEPGRSGSHTTCTSAQGSRPQRG